MGTVNAWTGRNCSTAIAVVVMTPAITTIEEFTRAW